MFHVYDFHSYIVTGAKGEWQVEELIMDRNLPAMPVHTNKLNRKRSNKRTNTSHQKITTTRYCSGTMTSYLGMWFITQQKTQSVHQVLHAVLIQRNDTILEKYS